MLHKKFRGVMIHPHLKFHIPSCNILLGSTIKCTFYVAALLSFHIFKQLLFTRSCIPFEHLTRHKIQDVTLNGTTVTSTSEGSDVQTRLVMSRNYIDSKTPQKVVQVQLHVWCHKNNLNTKTLKGMYITVYKTMAVSLGLYSYEMLSHDIVTK
jgi:hypothetical protein